MRKFFRKAKERLSSGRNHNTEELLSFYQSESRLLYEELGKTKAALEERELEVETLKQALKAAEGKAKRLERRNIKLSAIEKVWKDAFSKMKIVNEANFTPND